MLIDSNSSSLSVATLKDKAWVSKISPSTTFKISNDCIPESSLALTSAIASKRGDPFRGLPRAFS